MEGEEWEHGEIMDFAEEDVLNVGKHEVGDQGDTSAQSFEEAHIEMEGKVDGVGEEANKKKIAQPRSVSHQLSLLPARSFWQRQRRRQGRKAPRRLPPSQRIHHDEWFWALLLIYALNNDGFTDKIM